MQINVSSLIFQVYSNNRLFIKFESPGQLTSQQFFLSFMKKYNILNETMADNLTAVEYICIGRQKYRVYCTHTIRFISLYLASLRKSSLTDQPKSSPKKSVFSERVNTKPSTWTIKIYHHDAPCCTNPRCTRMMLAGFILSPSLCLSLFLSVWQEW